MIERYCTEAMNAIWSREAKYEVWKLVEVAICEGHCENGLIPRSDFEAIQKHAAFTLERCDEIEKETRHDLAAFVRCLEESVNQATGGTEGRWIHFGVTSYDVIDTALGIMLRETCVSLASRMGPLLAAIEALYEKHGSTPCIGRTHGIHAEPITFGFKVSSWRAELIRSRERIERHRREIAVGKISGAVGIHAHVDPATEKQILAKLGLTPDPVSTQIVNRDRLAAMMSDLAVLAGGLERIATELRNLQRTEILEVQEEFAAGQTGSSAMPHKRNPWNSETVVGLSRIVRSNAHVMLESIATWHERDLTNSSLERIILPDTFHLVDFMISRLTKILSVLVVMPDRMQANLRLMGDLVFSEHLMVSLIGKGMTRRDAYKVAQRHAAAAWDGHDFQTSVRQDTEVAALLTSPELDVLFSLDHHLQHAGHSWTASETGF